jgi:hypothetical protein
MKTVAIALAFAGALLFGAWLASALGWWPRGDVARDVPPELAALHGHFSRQGVETTVALVRREHAGVRYRAMFVAKDEARQAFFVHWCASDGAVRERVAALKASSAPPVVEARGLLVLQIAGWPADDPVARRIVQAFHGFDTRDIRPEGE